MRGQRREGGWSDTLLVRYLKTLGVIEIPNETTRKAIKELDEGKGTVCNTFEEYLEAIK